MPFRDARRLPARDRQRVEIAEQLEDDRLPIRHHVQRDPRPLAQRELEFPRRVERQEFFGRRRLARIRACGCLRSSREHSQCWVTTAAMKREAFTGISRLGGPRNIRVASAGASRPLTQPNDGFTAEPQRTRSLVTKRIKGITGIVGIRGIFVQILSYRLRIIFLWLTALLQVHHHGL